MRASWKWLPAPKHFDLVSDWREGKARTLVSWEAQIQWWRQIILLHLLWYNNKGSNRPAALKEPCRGNDHRQPHLVQKCLKLWVSDYKCTSFVVCSLNPVQFTFQKLGLIWLTPCPPLYTASFSLSLSLVSQCPKLPSSLVLLRLSRTRPCYPHIACVPFIHHPLLPMIPPPGPKHFLLQSNTPIGLTACSCFVMTRHGS